MPEKKLTERPAKILLCAGTDEAGRGPLAGPVVASTVILRDDRPIPGLADSKKLTAKKREMLAALIKERALAWSIAQASVEEIDTLNILQATLLAMKRAIEALPVRPDKVLIDGNRVPDVTIPCEAIIGGDATIACISAASILAKVERDFIMATCPEAALFSFHIHKGYGTRLHLEELTRHGPSAIHRKSFAPVRKLLGLDPADRQIDLF